MADAPDIRDELNEATEDLRDTLHQINNRVEARVAKFRPDLGIRKHPVTTACLAAGLGFSLGAESGEASMIGLLLLGAAFVLSRTESGGHSGEAQRI